MAILKIDHVNILSANAQETADYYVENLGFTQADKRETPDMIIVDLKKGPDFIEVIQSVGQQPSKNGGFKHLAFLSDDIEGDYQAFKAKGARLLHDQVQHSGPRAFFFMCSPSGEWLEVIQYMQA